MFFVNRVYRENLCLRDMDCYELVIRNSYDNEDEFDLDGSYEIWWNGVRKTVNAAPVLDTADMKKKEEETFRFGNGCASLLSTSTTLQTVNAVVVDVEEF